MKTLPFIAIVLIAASAWAQPAPHTVLFVCEHGAAKSVVAAAHFNKLAAERGLPFRAISRGTAPRSDRTRADQRGIEQRRADDATGLLTGPGRINRRGTAARVVTFDVTLPVSPNASRLTRWDSLPAFSDGYGPASAAIAAKVDALVRELETAAKKK